MRMKGALAETKGALVITEPVGGEAQLRVLEAGIEAGQVHLAVVHLVVVGKLGQRLEEVVEARVTDERGGRALGMVQVRMGGGGRAGEREGDHGDGPATQAHGGQSFTFGVEVRDERLVGIPVALEVEVLDGIHGGVLQLVKREARGEQVKTDHGPVEVLRGRLAFVERVADGIVQVPAEGGRVPQPLGEEDEHGGRLAGQPERDSTGATVRRRGRSLKLVAEERGRGAEVVSVDLEARLLGANEDDGDGIRRRGGWFTRAGGDSCCSSRCSTGLSGPGEGGGEGCHGKDTTRLGRVGLIGEPPRGG